MKTDKAQDKKMGIKDKDSSKKPDTKQDKSNYKIKKDNFKKDN